MGLGVGLSAPVPAGLLLRSGRAVHRGGLVVQQETSVFVFQESNDSDRMPHPSLDQGEGPEGDGGSVCLASVCPSAPPSLGRKRTFLWQEQPCWVEEELPSQRAGALKAALMNSRDLRALGGGGGRVTFFPRKHWKKKPLEYFVFWNEVTVRQSDTVIRRCSCTLRLQFCL